MSSQQLHTTSLRSGTSRLNHLVIVADARQPVLQCMKVTCNRGGPRKKISDTITKNLEQAQGPTHPPAPWQKGVPWSCIVLISHTHTFWTFFSETLTGIGQVLDLLKELICWHDTDCRVRRGPLGLPFRPCRNYMMPYGPKNTCKR
jgi:hypothetical protein